MSAADLNLTIFLLTSTSLLCLLTFLVASRRRRSNGGSKSQKNESKTKNTKFPPVTPIGFLDIIRAALNPSSNYGELCTRVGQDGPLHLLRFSWPKLGILIINDLELGKELFNSAVFSDRPIQNEFWTYHAKGNYGIVTSSGKVWEEQRKFTLRKLKDAGIGNKSMENLIAIEVDDFIQTLEADKGQLISPNKRTSVPFFNTIWVVLTGQRFCHKDQAMSSMLLGIYEAFMQILEVPQIFLLAYHQSPISIQMVEKFPIWLPFFNRMSVIGQGFDKLRIFCEKLVTERQQSLNDPQAPESFIDDYLREIEMTTNEKSTFYKKEGVMNLIGTIGDLFIAGGETEANTLAWCMLHLIRNPEVQLKIQEELDRVVGRERRPTLSDLPNCAYTFAFIHEVLRVTPASLFSLPHVTTEDVDIGPYFVEKHTTVILNIPAIHSDPKYWKDPECFLPERFLTPDGSQFIKNPAMVAFSIGKRKCPADHFALTNLFLFVSAIGQKFNLKKDPNLIGLPPLSPELSGLYAPKKYFMVVEER